MISKIQWIQGKFKKIILLIGNRIIKRMRKKKKKPMDLMRISKIFNRSKIINWLQIKRFLKFKMESNKDKFFLILMFFKKTVKKIKMVQKLNQIIKTYKNKNKNKVWADEINYKMNILKNNIWKMSCNKIKILKNYPQLNRSIMEMI